MRITIARSFLKYVNSTGLLFLTLEGLKRQKLFEYLTIKLVEDFLKSDQQQIIYRNFASSFSITMKESGRGNEAISKNSFIEIKKTNEWYNLKTRLLSKYFKVKKK